MNNKEALYIVVAQLQQHHITSVSDPAFYNRFIGYCSDIAVLFLSLYQAHPQHRTAFEKLTANIIDAYISRPPRLKDRDNLKPEDWFLSNELAGMSLYVDRFAGNLKNLKTKLSYFQKLGVNLLHLMPVFESPPAESDGGYAVSDFRKVDARFGTLEDLLQLQQTLQQQDMYLMLDIVLNHTSRKHAWATAAKDGDAYYQDYYYFFNNRGLPDAFDAAMPEIFPESSPGNFTYIEELQKWVMTVFHHYQWDLNYRNPMVLADMLSNIFFYANSGVDILRIDAPAFLWKELHTTCQNLPEAHTLLQLIKQCVQIATPGMALLGEAIVAPREIMKYFGTGSYTARECDFAYNATHMALQWDAIATGDTRIMLAAQQGLLQKPYGTSWITYTRCHDDIGLGFDDSMIQQAGFDPYRHRRFLKEFLSGQHPFSSAAGALFSVNEKTGDARISGSLAALCGLEKALAAKDEGAIQKAVDKILLMQAQSFFLGGLPMIFYGDELGYTNDYSFLNDSAKSYDNRWMHRPVIDWEKNALTEKEGAVEQQIFSATKKLLAIRKSLPVIADKKNLTFLHPHNIHVNGYLRAWGNDRIYCLFNFGNHDSFITWYAFKEHGMAPRQLFDHWSGITCEVGNDYEYLILKPYQFCILQPV